MALACVTNSIGDEVAGFGGEADDELGSLWAVAGGGEDVRVFDQLEFGRGAAGFLELAGGDLGDAPVADGGGKDGGVGGEEALHGSGHVEGIVDASAPNNASLCGANVPALVFGIPGIAVRRGQGDIVITSTRAGVGIVNVEGQQCLLQVYLDNTPIDNESLVALDPLTFRSVEVYPQTVQLTGLAMRPDRCGAVVINSVRR